jgi:hypothetical protein
MRMPRQKSIVTIIRDLVRTEIQKALSSLFGGLGVVPGVKGAKVKAKAKNGRRRRRKAGAPARRAKRGRRKGTRRRKTGQASEA